MGKTAQFVYYNNVTVIHKSTATWKPPASYYAGSFFCHQNPSGHRYSTSVCVLWCLASGCWQWILCFLWVALLDMEFALGSGVNILNSLSCSLSHSWTVFAVWQNTLYFKDTAIWKCHYHGGGMGYVWNSAHGSVRLKIKIGRQPSCESEKLVLAKWLHWIFFHIWKLIASSWGDQ